MCAGKSEEEGQNVKEAGVQGEIRGALAVQDHFQAATALTRACIRIKLKEKKYNNNTHSGSEARRDVDLDKKKVTEKERERVSLMKVAYAAHFAFLTKSTEYYVSHCLCR